MSKPPAADIAQLLSQAESAHGEYETRVLKGVRDEEWPVWYAHYLVLNGLPELCSNVITPGELAAHLPEWLAEAEQSHLANAPQEDWRDYYATFLIKTIYGDEDVEASEQ